MNIRNACLKLLLPALFCWIMFGSVANAQYNGWWYNPNEEGSGVSIEIQGTWLFLALYTYNESGQSLWLTSDGPMSAGAEFSGDLKLWTGWPLNGAPGAFNFSTAGSISIAFSSSNQARMTITYNGAQFTKDMVKFLGSISPGPKEIKDIHGWWYDPVYAGSGVFVEAQGGTIFLAWYHYREDSTPRWYTSGGAFPEGSQQFSGSLLDWSDGQRLGGAYKQPAPPVARETVTLQFNPDGAATLIWPGGTWNLQRFPIGTCGYSVSDLAGSWTLALSGAGMGDASFSLDIDSLGKVTNLTGAAQILSWRGEFGTDCNGLARGNLGLSFVQTPSGEAFSKFIALDVNVDSGGFQSKSALNGSATGMVSVNSNGGGSSTTTISWSMTKN